MQVVAVHDVAYISLRKVGVLDSVHKVFNRESDSFGQVMVILFSFAHNLFDYFFDESLSQTLFILDQHVARPHGEHN